MNLREMFEIQFSLAKRFHRVEYENGFHLHDGFETLRHGTLMEQSLLRRYCWYITEEIGEAIQEWQGLPCTAAFQEEVSDAFHFLLELGIYLGVDPATLSAVYEWNRGVIVPKRNEAEAQTVFTTYWIEVFRNLTSLCWRNCKLKPWKRPSVSTVAFDLESVRNDYACTFDIFLRAVRRSGMKIEDLENSFALTKEKNEERLGQ